MLQKFWVEKEKNNRRKESERKRKKGMGKLWTKIESDIGNRSESEIEIKKKG